MQAIWSDVNTNLTRNQLAPVVTNNSAISNSLFNLLNCLPGGRARTFQPTYGSILYQFIHEPITDLTAAKMRIWLVQAIANWEPRVKLNEELTIIEASLELPGYMIRLAWEDPTNPGQNQILNLTLPVGNN